jgi:hypothetical protein
MLSDADVSADRSANAACGVRASPRTRRKAAASGARKARWCMKTRILAVIPASQWHMERAKAGLAILMPER